MSIIIAMCLKTSIFLVFRRICRTRTSTGTRPASSATNAGCPWWTNSSAARWTRFTAATATMPNSLAAAMDAAKSSVLVRILYTLFLFDSHR